jgi:hypothetical protein
MGIWGDRNKPLLLFLRRVIMGKYVLAWILGVPAFVLIIIYFLMN